jgi:hypothetical protein
VEGSDGAPVPTSNPAPNPAPNPASNPASRGGARRAAKPKRSFRPRLLLLGLGALVALAAWGALVWVAIHYGRSARGGESGKWGYLAAASVGAVLCLFVCLWLCTVLLRAAGIIEDRRPAKPKRDKGQPHRH